MKDGFILTINAGSSSLKFALFRAGDTPARELAGKFERIGMTRSKLTISEAGAKKAVERPFHAPDHLACAASLRGLVKANADEATIRAVGHRIVHGGPRYHEPQPIDGAMLRELRRIRSFDPEHLPAELALVDHFTRRYPGVPQVACFDTAFHHNMPRVAKLLPIPRRYEAQGIQRYGFHGLS